MIEIKVVDKETGERMGDEYAISQDLTIDGCPDLEARVWTGFKGIYYGDLVKVGGVIGVVERSKFGAPQIDGFSFIEIDWDHGYKILNNDSLRTKIAIVVGFDKVDKVMEIINDV